EWLSHSRSSGRLQIFSSEIGEKIRKFRTARARSGDSENEPRTDGATNASSRFQTLAPATESQRDASRSELGRSAIGEYDSAKISSRCSERRKMGQGSFFIRVKACSCRRFE